MAAWQQRLRGSRLTDIWQAGFDCSSQAKVLIEKNVVCDLAALKLPKEKLTVLLVDTDID